ncbi:hypothetical protein AAFC00_000469 [Neodothiora populina]|uniref:Uncharacterized protein n=1 Tax=Neodothiora populina TaxID=2781224 RepID=A0ABR3PD00_9PEZI
MSNTPAYSTDATQSNCVASSSTDGAPLYQTPMYFPTQSYYPMHPFSFSSYEYDPSMTQCSTIWGPQEPPANATTSAASDDRILYALPPGMATSTNSLPYGLGISCPRSSSCSPPNMLDLQPAMPIQHDRRLLPLQSEDTHMWPHLVNGSYSPRSHQSQMSQTRDQAGAGSRRRRDEADASEASSPSKRRKRNSSDPKLMDESAKLLFRLRDTEMSWAEVTDIWSRRTGVPTTRDALQMRFKRLRIRWGASFNPPDEEALRKAREWYKDNEWLFISNKLSELSDIRDCPPLVCREKWQELEFRDQQGTSTKSSPTPQQPTTTPSSTPQHIPSSPLPTGLRTLQDPSRLLQAFVTTAPFYPTPSIAPYSEGFYSFTGPPLIE